MYEGRERQRFTQEDLDAIHQGYEEELAGKRRRGKEPRYWEDVAVGDTLPTMVNGPYDISDAVAYIGNTGYMSAYAVKWGRVKNDAARMPRDPETGEVHHIIDWRLSDAVAQATGGSPYAQAFGLGLECSLGHSITNWMGDDGFLKRSMFGWTAASFMERCLPSTEPFRENESRTETVWSISSLQ